jgi:hypothetical protein
MINVTGIFFGTSICSTRTSSLSVLFYITATIVTIVLSFAVSEANKTYEILEIKRQHVVSPLTIFESRSHVASRSDRESGVGSPLDDHKFVSIVRDVPEPSDREGACLKLVIPPIRIKCGLTGVRSTASLDKLEKVFLAKIYVVTLQSA